MGPHDDKIVSVHGKATLSRVKKGAKIVGYHITCRNHSDDDDREGVICEKALMFGKNPLTRITGGVQMAPQVLVHHGQRQRDSNSAVQSMGGREVPQLPC